MKKSTFALSALLITNLCIGAQANAAETILPPAYLERDARSHIPKDMAVKLSDEVKINLGRVGSELLRSVKTRDGLIVLLRYFAENCQECTTAAQLVKNVMPTRATNYFLSPERKVSPTLDSMELSIGTDNNQAGWDWFPDTTIKPEDLGCLNCISGHCP